MNKNLKRWPDECWKWTQKRPIRFGDVWYLIRHPIKVIRLAHFGLYGIIHAQIEKTSPGEICREIIEDQQYQLDKGEPLGKSPFWKRPR